jgi:hypothetical protein
MSFDIDRVSIFSDQAWAANVSVERGLCKVTKPAAVSGRGQPAVENVPPRYFPPRY